MSAADLGMRMGVTRQAINALEASERNATARMSTLATAAQAMDCQLVYALIPNQGSLNGIMHAEAGRVVDIDLAAVAQTMLLEGVVVESLPTDRQDHIDDLIASSGKRLWRTRAKR